MHKYRYLFAKSNLSGDFTILARTARVAVNATVVTLAPACSLEAMGNGGEQGAGR